MPVTPAVRIRRRFDTYTNFDSNEPIKHHRGPAGASVAGRSVPDDDEGDDLAVADGEVVGQDDLVRQVRPVEVAVVASADDGLAVVVGDLGGVDVYPVADH